MYNDETNEISSILCQIAGLHSMQTGCEICSIIEPYDDVYICEYNINSFMFVEFVIIIIIISVLDL